MSNHLVHFICVMFFFASILAVFATFCIGYLIGRHTEIDIFDEIQE